MDRSTQTMASFTGTLLKHEHVLGQKFVQLVFREDDKNVLCVSTDPRTATLKVGQIYRVEGTFKYRDKRPFVYDPKIAVFKRHWIPVSRRIFMAVGIVCFVTVITAVPMQGRPTKAASMQPVTQAAVHKATAPQPVAATSKPVATPAPNPTPTYHAPIIFRQVSRTVPSTSTATPIPSSVPAATTTPVTPQAQTTPVVPDATSSTNSSTPTSPATPPAANPVTTDPSTPSTPPTDTTPVSSGTTPP